MPQNGRADRPAQAHLPTSDELHKVAEKIEAEKAREARARVEEHQRHERELHRRFEEEKIGPDTVAWLETHLRRAASMGQTEIMAVKFRASFLPDHGRAINNGEPDWPDSLAGFARSAYDYYVRELQPRGYRLSARVLDYPDGMPGHVGMFLSW